MSQVGTFHLEEWSESTIIFRPFRVFINHMDSFHGKKLVNEFLSGFYLYQGSERWNEDCESQIGELEPIRRYEVIGTVANHSTYSSESVRIISTENEEIFLDELLSCGYIIYDISLDDDEVDKANFALNGIVARLETRMNQDSETSDEVRHFVLISNVMTWAQTIQLDSKYPEAPLTEADFAKRIAHPKFEKQAKCETDVVMVKERPRLKEVLRTLVLCSGITYGDEEGPIHFLFKLAWHNTPFLPIFGSGTNKIPLLHVRQLSRIVLELFRSWPYKKWYIVATELDPVSQITIVKNICQHFKTEGIKFLEKTDNQIFPRISQREKDIITLDVNIEPAYIVDASMQSDNSFVLNMKDIAEEYRHCRNLQAVKILVCGPPASGKSSLARRLANYYRLPLIKVGNLINDTIQNLAHPIETLETVDVNFDNNDNDGYKKTKINEEDENKIKSSSELLSEFQKQYDNIRNNLEANNGRLSDDILIKLIAKKLLSNKCQNQGYVLDGYPKTLEQARGLFAFTQKAEITRVTENSQDEMNKNLDVMPEVVILLVASDDFLWERVLNLPESRIQGTHYNVESMFKRLRTYRDINMTGRSPLGFFIDNGVHTVSVSIEKDCPEMHSTFEHCIETIEESRNYGTTTLKLSAEGILRDVEKKRPRTVNVKSRKYQEPFLADDNFYQIMMAWEQKLEKNKRDDEKKLQKLSGPLQLYLVKCVFPTLNMALIKSNRLRPSDPIDWIAEYLFKENPAGKMFEDTMQQLNDSDSSMTNQEWNGSKDEDSDKSTSYF